MNGPLNQDTLWLIAVSAVVLLVCFPVHECAHALVAYKLGDPTGKEAGRISLNPFKHLDLWGSISLLLIGIGFAKPVPVNLNNFRKRKQYYALTALAGPVSNLLMAVLFFVLAKTTAAQFGNGGTGYSFLLRAAYINVSLAVFNMIPIPPLDGSKVLSAVLSDSLYNKFLSSERYTSYLVMGGFILLNRMGFSPISALTRPVYLWIAKAVGVV